MNQKVRGIECSLYNGKFMEVLFHLSTKYNFFYIPWCKKFDNKKMLLPKATSISYVTANGLRQIAKQSIWELVLHIYPEGAIINEINTYTDFIESSCECCLIFYDCGMLDLYIKDPILFEDMWEKLELLQASDLSVITELNDTRTMLHV